MKSCRGDSRIARLWAANDRPYDSLPPSKLRFATSLPEGGLGAEGALDGGRRHRPYFCANSQVSRPSLPTEHPLPFRFFIVSPSYLVLLLLLLSNTISIGKKRQF